MLSETPFTPGLSAHAPRTTSSIFTPACEAVYSARITASSRSAFIFATIRAGRLKHVWQSPFTLHKRVVEAIRNEARIATEGRPARIVAKMNALLEPGIIDELYAASRAGVKVDLIVRGICALRPGVEGLSENIRVRSIVGRFLEHSRVFWFKNDGADDVWLSSADWMDRNFFRRIELGFPILDGRLKRRVIKEGLKPCLDDNCQSWVMDAEGGYQRQAPKAGKRYSAQEELLSLLSLSG